MKEVRLRYNDQEELIYLIMSAEAHMNMAEIDKNMFYATNFITLDDSKTGMQIKIKVRATKTGIIVAETQKTTIK